MFCNHCGAEIKDGVKFCDKCGGKIEVAKPQSVNAGANTQAEKSVAVTPAQNETQANSAEQPQVGTNAGTGNNTKLLVGGILCFAVEAFILLLLSTGLFEGSLITLLWLIGLPVIGIKYLYGYFKSRKS